MGIYETLAMMERTGEAGVLCTIIESSGSIPRHSGSKMIVYPDGHISGSVGGGEIENRTIQEALQALEEGHPRILSYSLVDPARGDVGVCGGTAKILLEPILPKPVVLVIGGGHVGKAVAKLAKFVGFKVVVSDDRPEFCTPEANPDADEFVCAPMEQLPQKYPINRSTYLVLTTRGMVVDVPGIPALLDTPAAYIGVIGSKRRFALTKKDLIAKGTPEEKFAKVHSPVGLELQAETPEEIAVSILAEIIMLRNGGSGKPMKI